MFSAEGLTQKLAVTLSRRAFLKSLGLFVATIGATLAGQPETADAEPACCPDPECSGCQAGGSICPPGYTRIAITRCCLDGCWWTCSTCRSSSPPYNICYCSHEDFTLCGAHCILRSGVVLTAE